MPHEPVLVALKQLTEQDFGFDKQSWRSWWSQQGKQSLGIPDGSPKKRPGTRDVAALTAKE